MKLNSTYENSVLASNCELNGTTFRIKACPEAFKILTDNLYNDKIQTIIRELSCNAYDSQVQNGNPNQPFDIYIPDRLNPIFYIRDYGIGLTKEEIQQIYTTYFESTKSTSNDYIGAFGLGSKTPLAYTDQFTVTSYKDGMEYVYRVYISNKGFPEIQLVIERETKEPNGLKVQVSVEDNDIGEFKEKIKTFFSYNNINPNFLNVKIEPKLEVLYTYKNLKYINSYSYSSKFFARIGMVTYPIPSFTANDLVEQLSDRNCIPYEFIYYIINNSPYSKAFLIDFNIGELAVTASRESLSMDKETKENLYKKLANLFEEMYNTCAQDLKKVTNISEFIKNLQIYPVLIYKPVYQVIQNNLNNDYFSYSDFSLKLKFAFHKEIENMFEGATVLNYSASKSGYRYNHSKYEYYCQINKENIFNIKIGNLPRSQIREISLPNKKSFTYIKVKNKEIAEKIKEHIQNKFSKELFQIDVFCIEKESQPKKVYDKSKAIPVINKLIYFKLDATYYNVYNDCAKNLNKEDTIYFVLKNSFSSFSYKDLLRFYNPNISKVYLLTKTQERILTRYGYKLEDLQRFFSDSCKERYSIKIEVAKRIFDQLYNIEEYFEDLSGNFNIKPIIERFKFLKSLDTIGYYETKKVLLISQRILNYFDNRIVNCLENNNQITKKLFKSLIKEAFNRENWRIRFLDSYFPKSYSVLQKMIEDL